MTVDIETLAAEISYFELTFNFIDREVQSEDDLFTNKKGKSNIFLLNWWLNIWLKDKKGSSNSAVNKSGKLHFRRFVQQSMFCVKQ